VVTSCGAEALPFINGFCVLPMSLAFFFYYDKLVGSGRAALGRAGRLFCLQTPNRTEPRTKTPYQTPHQPTTTKRQ
jgi:hypothetical protein